MSEDMAKKPNPPLPAAEPDSPVSATPAALKANAKEKKKQLKLVQPDQSGAIAEEKSKVIQIFRRMEEENDRWRTKRTRAPWLLLSVLVCIALPTLIASAYFYLIAADRYIAEARFAIRSNESSPVDALGALTGMPSSSTFADSFMVTDYIGSREMVRLLDEELSLRAIYTDERADFLTRLDPDVSLERLVAYWNKRVDVSYDPMKTTIALDVQAFDPEHAATIANAILSHVRELVNNISANARRDAERFAAQELARSELRLRNTRREVLEFRLANNSLDPMVSAGATLQIASGLEQERAQLAAQLASVSGYLSENSPSVRVLKARMAALQSEIDLIQGQVSKASTDTGDRPGQKTQSEDDAPVGAMATTVGQYQELQADQLLAEKAYASSLISLERARAEAERTQSYLAVYLPPEPTDAPALPRRGRSVLIVLVLATVLWAIGLLAQAVIRDHVA